MDIKKMLKILLSVGLSVCLFACTARIREESFIAQSERVDIYTQQDINNWQQLFTAHQLKNISLTSEDKSASLHGIYLDNKQSNDVIFFIQGNGMRLSEGGIKALLDLATLNRDLVFFDRRGVGASSGQANINNLISDANDAYDFIKREIAPDRIIIHGYSLGSFIAAELAKQKSIDALVLQGAATNVDEWVASRLPWYAGPFFTVDIDPAFEVADNKTIVAQNYSKPLLVIAAEDDEQVPAELSKQLYEASQSENKYLIMVENSGHGEMFDHPGTLEGYLKFLDSL
jgi:pimeloyl-ACP methyl ester carboxylesterase